MELPKGRYPQSDTAAPTVRHCGTHSPTLRHPKSVTVAPKVRHCRYASTEGIRMGLGNQINLSWLFIKKRDKD